MDRHVRAAPIAAVGSWPCGREPHAPHNQRTDAGAEDEQEDDAGHGVECRPSATAIPGSTGQPVGAELDRRVRTRSTPCTRSRHPKVVAPMKM